jgi:drug/metabolite transporter, DME family
VSEMASTATSRRSSSRAAYLGYIYIGLAAALWGVSASLGRAAFTERLLPGSGIRNISPLILSQARTTFSFGVVLFVLLIRRGRKQLRMPRHDLLRAFVLGLGGIAASNYFYYLAIQRTNVATAIIVQYTAPVWVLVYMVLRRAERLTLSKMASVLLAIIGIALVIGLFGQGGLQLDALGVSAALIAAFSFTFYNIGGHYILAKYDRWTVLLFTTMSASLFWMVLNPPNKIIAAHYSGSAWLFLLIFAMLSVLLPFSLYFAGLQHLEPTKAIVASCLEPVFTILIAAVALKEVVHPLQGLGIVMVLCAILVVQMPVRAASQPPVGPVD